MAMASSIGADIEAPDGAPPLHAWLFGEDQGRYLVTTNDPHTLLKAAKKAGVPAQKIGTTGGRNLTVNGSHAISVADLRDSHMVWLPNYMRAS